MLKQLHAIHPSWMFEPLMTGVDWNAVLDDESTVYTTNEVPSSKSRIQGNVGYRSTDSSVYNWETDSWKAIESGVWYAANRDTVAYYLDPRNFLNESKVFMFEDLSYNSTYQKIDTVSSILPTNDLKSNANALIDVAGTHNVSPVYLAALVKQEGAYTTAAGSGYGTTGYTGGQCYSDENGYSLSTTGVYNFYNIDAVNDNVICNALAFANARQNGTIIKNGIIVQTTPLTSYMRPWTTIYKSLAGGGRFVAVSYISRGQNNVYLKKFQVIPIKKLALDNSGEYFVTSEYDTKLFMHQYQTNIVAASSEASIIYSAYNNANLITDNSVVFKFKIPVYNNMPSSTALPPTGNPNSYLNGLSVNGTSVPSFNMYNTSYTVVVPSATSNVTISASKINSAATISGADKVDLNAVETTKSIVVTAENGNKTTYQIKFVKSDTAPITNETIINNLKLTNTSGYLKGFTLGTDIGGLINTINGTSNLISTTIKDVNGNVKVSGRISTGDKVIINNSGTETSYIAVIYGDNNNDGLISLKDLLLVQKHLLKSINLTNAYFNSSDVNKDGKVDLKDLLLVQKHLLGSTTISQ
jgi:beta-N-acetylglucosaminidase